MGAVFCKDYAVGCEGCWPSKTKDGCTYVTDGGPMQTPVLSEVFSSLVPLRRSRSASVPPPVTYVHPSVRKVTVTLVIK